MTDDWLNQLERPTHKPRHASVCNTLADTQAVPAFSLYMKIQMRFSCLKTYRHYIPLLSMRPKLPDMLMFVNRAFDTRMFDFDTCAFARLSSITIRQWLATQPLRIISRPIMWEDAPTMSHNKQRTHDLHAHVHRYLLTRFTAWKLWGDFQGNFTHTGTRSGNPPTFLGELTLSSRTVSDMFQN